MEHAVAHGYLMATVKDYAAKRARDRRAIDLAPGVSQDWVAGLMALSGQVRGAGTVSTAPADSPVAGLTPESFRADVAGMRAAEYAIARERRGRPD